MDKKEYVLNLEKIYTAICALTLSGESNIATRYHTLVFIKNLITQLKDIENNQNNGEKDEYTA